MHLLYYLQMELNNIMDHQYIGKTARVIGNVAQIRLNELQQYAGQNVCTFLRIMQVARMWAVGQWVSGLFLQETMSALHAKEPI